MFQTKKYIDCETWVCHICAPFINHVFDYDKALDRAYSFEKVLGYTKNNYKDFIENIFEYIDKGSFIEKGYNGYGIFLSKLLN